MLRVISLIELVPASLSVENLSPTEFGRVDFRILEHRDDIGMAADNPKTNAVGRFIRRLMPPNGLFPTQPIKKMVRKPSFKRLAARQVNKFQLVAP